MPSNYLAVDVPEEIRTELCLIQGIIQELDPGFKPYQFEKIHMTLLYMGQRFKEENKEALEQFDKDVKSIIKRPYTLVFDKPRVELFPPGKGNLVVIEYNCNSDGNVLFGNLLGHIDDGTHGRDSWRPHITLGKLSNIKVDLSGLEKGLNDLITGKFESKGFHLVGTSEKNKLKWEI